MNDLHAVMGILMFSPPRPSYEQVKNSDTAIADAEEGPAIGHSAAQEVGSCKRHGSCGRSALDNPVTVDSSRTALRPCDTGRFGSDALRLSATRPRGGDQGYGQLRLAGSIPAASIPVGGG